MLGTLVLASVLSLGLCAGGWSDVPQDQWSTYETTLSELNKNGGLFAQNCVTTRIETQVVAGLNIRYHKQCGQTSCTIMVWQKVWENFVQVTENLCSTGHKRQMAGGWSQVTDQALITEYETILTDLQSNGNLTLASQFTINKIESQVVAGKNIKYYVTVHNKDCTIVVYDIPWEHTRTITHNDCPVHKRQLGLVGGYSVVTDQVQITKYETMLSDLETQGEITLQHYTVTQIETQVVAGLNIKYTLSMGQKTCTVVVYDAFWDPPHVSSNTCGHARRQLLGGFYPVDASNPEVQQCLGMGLDSINGQVNSMYRMVDSNVKAEQQVVAGMNYAITFDILPSTCMNSGDSNGFTSTDCPVNTNMNVTPDTWKVRCFKSLQGDMSITDLHQDRDSNPNAATNVDVDQVLTQNKAGLMKSNDPAEVKVNVDDSPSTNLLGMNVPVLSMVRRKRDLRFLTDKLNALQHLGSEFAEDNGLKLDDGKDLINHIRNLPQKNKDVLLDEAKSLLGGDGHDYMKHAKNLLGGDDHDLVKHVQDILGGDGHDYANHMKNLIGGDDHDLVNHGQKLLGGDDHDLVNHGQKILGGDDHDLVNHGQKILGGDDHDLVNHGQKILGGDDHDLVNHGQKMLGGDDHDLVNHGQKMLGGDDHDLVNHGQKLLGGDDHDLVNHGQKLLGGDDHDLVNHGQKLLGGDDHDLVNHGQKILGGDGHDLVNHGQKLLGGDDHDLVNHGQKMLGGDGHDDCHKGMFENFKQNFNKLYGSSKEEEKRFYIFCQNMRTARKLQETEKGSARYGATKFADLTKEEFQQYVGKQWDISAKYRMKKATIPNWKAPESFDWRDHGAVTPVKNQGSCGSCWAFSTTGNIEGQWAIKKKQLISLSEQELVDCDKIDEGCNGGLPSDAYKEIERLGGLETEDDYSYKGEDEKCVFNKADVKVYINDSVSISSDEDEMASWLAANGPISIGINAFAMQFYMGGISHPWKIFCNPKSLDHGVLIVGYGVHESEPYWIVKNSWGPDWGEKGYYLVYRGSGVCGLNQMCTSSVVD